MKIVFSIRSEVKLSKKYTKSIAIKIIFFPSNSSIRKIYHLIFITYTHTWETSLNDSVGLPETLLDGYTFVPANKPNNTRHGGVGLFYKNSLPVIVRNDLSFDESIELKFGRKKIFLLFYTKVLLLNIALPNFVPSCQISKNYIQKFKLKILLQLFFYW